MGNTIRREPVSFKIPDSPDYKFLNITNFQGIHQTDNPFLAASNTASDCLNVYVDETNTLTTRPRIIKDSDISSAITNFKKVIKTYSLNNKILFQIKTKEDVVEFYIKRDNVLFKVNTGDILLKDEEYGVTEQEDNVYVVCDDYYVIKPDNTLKKVLNDSDTYIPTVEIRHADSSNTPSVSLESYNLLSDKYRVEYYWDFNSDLSEEIGDGSVVENRYLKIGFSDNTNYGAIKSLSGSKLLSGNRNTPKILNIVDDKILTTDLPSDVTNLLYVSKDGNVFLYPGETTTQLKVYILDKNEYRVLDLPDELNLSGTQPYNFDNIIGDIYDNGDLFLLKTKNKLMLCKYEGVETNKYSFLVIVDFEEEVNKDPNDDWITNSTSFHMSEDTRRIIGLYGSAIWVFSNITFDEPDDIKRTRLTIDPIKYPSTLFVDSTATRIFMRNRSKSDYIREINISTGEIVEIDYSLKHKPTYGCVLSADEKSIIYLHGSGDVICCRKFILESNMDVLLYEYSIKDESALNATQIKRVLTPSGASIITMSYYPEIPERTYRAITLNIINLNTPGIVVEYENAKKESLSFSKILRYHNEYWFCGNSNLVRWTAKNDATYLPEENYTYLGLPEPVIDGTVVEGSGLVLFKKSGFYLASPVTISNEETYSFTEAKSTIGASSPHSAIVSKYSQIPMYVSSNGIYGLQQLSDVQSSEHNSVLLTERIEKFFNEHDIDKSKIISLSNLYWVFFVVPHETNSIIIVLDERTASWFIWEVPFNFMCAWMENDVFTAIDAKGTVYKLTTDDIVYENKTEYYDEGKILIPWFWRSQILPLGTINYSKKLNSTTFIMTDTDESDEYGLNYKFKVFRKLATESNATTISNRLNYIQSVTKKTIIPRFNFLQFEISNVEEDYDNNKLRLVGLSLKYELLAGLM